jgi:hypothetical protein
MAYPTVGCEGSGNGVEAVMSMLIPNLSMLGPERAPPLISLTSYAGKRPTPSTPFLTFSTEMLDLAHRSLAAGSMLVRGRAQA